MKKKIIVVVVLVAIAVVLGIVFVELFKDRTTTSLSSSVLNYSTNGYLSKKSDELTEYTTKLKNQLNASISSGDTSSENKEKYGKYVIEIDNFLSLYDSYILEADFYAENLYFTSYNNVYSKNQKKAREDLADAKDYLSNIQDYYAEKKSSLEGDWLIRSWEDLRGDALNFVKYNNSAFSRLKLIFTACGDGIENNDFATLILGTINTYTTKGAEDFSTSTTNSATSKKLAESYFSDDFHGISNYYLDEKLQDKVKSLLEDGSLAVRNPTNQESYDAFMAGTLGA